MLRPVSVAMLVGSIVVGGSAMLMLPTSVFMSIYSVLVAASFVANILAGVITLGMIRNYPNRP